MAMHPNVVCLSLDPKLTYSKHIHNIPVHAYKPLQIIKPLTATGWGKQKEAVMRPAPEYSHYFYNFINTIIHLNCLKCIHTVTFKFLINNITVLNIIKMDVPIV